MGRNKKKLEKGGENRSASAHEWSVLSKSREQRKIARPRMARGYNEMPIVAGPGARLPGIPAVKLYVSSNSETVTFSSV